MSSQFFSSLDVYNSNNNRDQPLRPAALPYEDQYWIGAAGRYGDHHKAHINYQHDPVVHYQHEQLLSKTIEPRPLNLAERQRLQRPLMNTTSNSNSRSSSAAVVPAQTTSKIYDRITPLFQPQRQRRTSSSSSTGLKTIMGEQLDQRKTKYFFPAQQQQQQQQQHPGTVLALVASVPPTSTQASAITSRRQSGASSSSLSVAIANVTAADFRSNSAPILPQQQRAATSRPIVVAAKPTIVDVNINKSAQPDPLITVLEHYSAATRDEIEEEKRHMDEMEMKLQELREAVRRGQFEKVQKEQALVAQEEQRRYEKQQSLAVVNQFMKNSNTSKSYQEQHRYITTNNNNNNNNNSNSGESLLPKGWSQLRNQVSSGGAMETQRPLDLSPSRNAKAIIAVFHPPSPQQQQRQQQQEESRESSVTSTEKDEDDKQKEEEIRNHSPPAHLIQDDDEEEEDVTELSDTHTPSQQRNRDQKSSREHEHVNNSVFSPPIAQVDVDLDDTTTLDMQTCAEGLVKYALKQHQIRAEREAKQHEISENDSSAVLKDAARFHPMLRKKHSAKQQQQQQQEEQSKRLASKSVSSSRNASPDNNNNNNESNSALIEMQNWEQEYERRRQQKEVRNNEAALILKFQTQTASVNAAEYEFLSKDAQLLSSQIMLSTLSHVSARLLTEHKCVARIMIELHKRIINEGIRSVRNSAMPPLSPRRNTGDGVSS